MITSQNPPITAISIDTELLSTAIAPELSGQVSTIQGNGGIFVHALSYLSSAETMAKSRHENPDPNGPECPYRLFKGIFVTKSRG
jgi:hypothetical protein